MYKICSKTERKLQKRFPSLGIHILANQKAVYDREKTLLLWNSFGNFQQVDAEIQSKSSVMTDLRLPKEELKVLPVPVEEDDDEEEVPDEEDAEEEEEEEEDFDEDDPEEEEDTKEEIEFEEELTDEESKGLDKAIEVEDSEDDESVARVTVPDLDVATKGL